MEEYEQKINSTFRSSWEQVLELFIISASVTGRTNWDRFSYLAQLSS